MYPLKAVLIDCQETDVPELRHELSNLGVQLEAEYPDVKAVIAGLTALQEEKRLFLIRVSSISDLRQLERLNEAFVGRPILALLDAGSDPANVTGAMRAGAAQVVLIPLQSDDFRNAMERIAQQFGYLAHASKLIAVTGGTEGCGATTIAINLASEIARLYQVPTILLEMSLRMGRIASYLDLEPRITTHELLSDTERMDIEVVQQALLKVEDHLRVLVGPFKGIPTGKITTQQVGRLVDLVRRLAHVVVLDMPYTFDDVYFDTIAVADQIVLVGEQNVPSIQALKMLGDTLRKIEGVGSQYVVINRYDPSQAEFRTTQLKTILQVPQLYTITNEWNAMLAATNNGRVLHQQSPKCRALGNVDTLAQSLMGVSLPKRPSWISTCLKRLVPTTTLN